MKFCHPRAYISTLLAYLVAHSWDDWTRKLLRRRPKGNVSHERQTYSVERAHTHARRLTGIGRTVPQKFEVGDGPCIRPPNISRSSVIGCVWKYQLGKNGVMEDFFCSELDFFRKEKDHNVSQVKSSFIQSSDHLWHKRRGVYRIIRQNLLNKISRPNCSQSLERPCGK